MGLFDKQDEGKMAGIAVVAAFALILASAYAIPRSVNESNSNKSPKSNQQSDNFLKSTINPKLIISTLPNEAKIIKLIRANHQFILVSEIGLTLKLIMVLD